MYPASYYCLHKTVLSLLSCTFIHSMNLFNHSINQSIKINFGQTQTLTNVSPRHSVMYPGNFERAAWAAGLRCILSAETRQQNACANFDMGRLIENHLTSISQLRRWSDCSYTRSAYLPGHIISAARGQSGQQAKGNRTKGVPKC